MKKWIAIAFLSMYLVTTTELHQLLKLPVLVEHFAEHKSKDHSITFWRFLYMHYAQGVVRDADYDKDMKLPFKSHSCCNSSITFVFLISEENYTFHVFKFLEERKSVTNFYTFLVSSSHLKAIWQPPQFC
jgi:hypothetical protein